jgi:hypothetical protein
MDARPTGRTHAIYGAVREDVTSVTIDLDSGQVVHPALIHAPRFDARFFVTFLDPEDSSEYGRVVATDADGHELGQTRLLVAPSPTSMAPPPPHGRPSPMTRPAAGTLIADGDAAGIRWWLSAEKNAADFGAPVGLCVYLAYSGGFGPLGACAPGPRVDDWQGFDFSVSPTRRVIFGVAGEDVVSIDVREPSGSATRAPWAHHEGFPYSFFAVFYDSSSGEPANAVATAKDGRVIRAGYFLSDTPPTQR